MAAKKEAQELRLDWPRDLNRVVGEFLKEPTITAYLERGPDDLALRQTLLSRLFHRRLDERIRAIVRKQRKEASQ
jgi:hypothetical protein